MALLLNARDLSKAYGSDPLFRNLTLNISEAERIGVIGPNGSGKSTLLALLAGRTQPDSGEVAWRKNTRVAYVEQDSVFAPKETVRDVVRRALETGKVPEEEKDSREAETLGRAGFTDLDVEAATLSGGWRKRLALAEALVADPDILLWMSRRTIWTWPAFSGWKKFCRARALLPGSQPRPLLSGKCSDRRGGDQSNLSRRHSARAWELQYVPGEERRVPGRPGQTPRRAGKSRTD